MKPGGAMAQAEAENFAAQSLHKTIRENVESLRDQRAGLVADISRLNDELLDLSKRLEETRRHHERELGSLQSQKSTEQQELLFLRQEVTRLKGSVEGLEPVKRHLEASISDRQTQIARLESRLSDARSAVDEYATQIDQARSLWNEVVTRATDETRKLEAMRSEAAKLEPQKKESIEIAERLGSLRAQEITLKSSIDELSSAEAELRTKVAALTVDFESQKRQELEFLRKQNEAELALSRARLERDALAARNQELRKDNEAIAEKIGKNQEKKGVLEQEIHSLQVRHKTLQAGIEPLREQVQMKEEELKRLVTEVESTRSTLRELASLLAEREKRLDSVTARHEELTAENRKVEGVIDALRSQEASWRTRIGEGQKELALLRAEMERGQRELGELSAEVGKFRELNDQVVVENAALQEALGRVQGELAEFERQRMKVQEEIEVLRAQRDSGLVEKSNLLEEIQALAERRREQENECSRRVSEMAELDDEIAARRAENERCRAELEELRSRCDGISVEKRTLEEFLSEMQGNADFLSRRVEELTNLEAGLGSVEARLAELQKSEEAVKSSIAALRRTEKGVSERIELLERQETGLLERIDKARSELSTTEQTHGSFMQKRTDAEEKYEKVSRNLEDITRKRDAVAELLKRDADAVRECREQLRHLEDLKAQKLRELQDMRDDFEKLDRKREVMALPETPLRVTSAEVRAEAERTLENLRRHLGTLGRDKEPGSDEE